MSGTLSASALKQNVLPSSSPSSIPPAALPPPAFPTFVRHPTSLERVLLAGGDGERDTVPLVSDVTLPEAVASSQEALANWCHGWLKQWMLQKGGMPLQHMQAFQRKEEGSAGLTVFQQSAAVCFQRDVGRGEAWSPLGKLAVATLPESVVLQLDPKLRYLFVCCLENVVGSGFTTAAAPAPSSSSPSSSKDKKRGGHHGLAGVVQRQQQQRSASALRPGYELRNVYLLGLIHVEHEAIRLATRVQPAASSFCKRTEKRARCGGGGEQERVRAAEAAAASASASAAAFLVNGRPITEPCYLLPIEYLTLDPSRLWSPTRPPLLPSPQLTALQIIKQEPLQQEMLGRVRVHRKAPTRYIYVFHWDAPVSPSDQRFLESGGAAAFPNGFEAAVMLRLRLLCHAYNAHHEDRRSIHRYQAKALPQQDPSAYQRDRHCQWFLLHVFCHREGMRRFFLAAEALLLENALGGLADAEDRVLVAQLNQLQDAAGGDLLRQASAWNTFEEQLVELQTRRLGRALRAAAQQAKALDLLGPGGAKAPASFRALFVRCNDYFRQNVPYLYEEEEQEEEADGDAESTSAAAAASNDDDGAEDVDARSTADP